MARAALPVSPGIRLAHFGRFRSAQGVLFWIATGLVALAIVYPVGRVIFEAFVEKGAFSLGGFIRMVNHRSIMREIGTTLVFAGGATLGASVIGIWLAWIIGRTDVPGRRGLEALCMVPLFTSALAGAIAWRFLLAPRAGVIHRMLTQWGVPPTLIPDVYSLPMMIFLQSLYYAPFMFQYAIASFRQMDPSLEESARIHGADGWQAVRRITLAVNAPALLSGMLFVFVLSIGTLEIPMALGTAGGNYVLSTRIYTILNVHPQDTQLAAALGLVTVLISGCGVILQRKILGKRRYTTVSGKIYQPRPIKLGRWRWPAFCAVGLYILIAVVLPLVVISMIALQRFWVGTFTPSLFTLENFKTVLLQYDVTRRAIFNSLVAFPFTATLAVMLATLLAQYLRDSGRFAQSLLDTLVLLPIAVPGAVFGMAALLATVGTPLYGSLWSIILALLFGNLYIAFRTVHSVRLSIHHELEESARIHGAPWWKAVYYVLLPLLKPGLVSGWLMSFVIYVREFSTPMFLYRDGSEVMSVVIWLLTQRHSGQLAAFMVVQALLLLILMRLYQKVTYGAKGGLAM